MRLQLSGEVWDIVQDGATLVITAAGKQSTRKFISPAHAEVQLKKLVGEKRAAGWVESSAELVLAPLEPRDPALEQQVLDALDEPGPYTVLADWYQAQGHPRGELIALQQAQADRDEKKLDDAIEKHFVRHKELLLGPLAGVDALEWRNGFVYGLTVNDVATAEAIARAVVGHASGRFLGAVKIVLNQEPAIESVLAALAPMASLLRELTIWTAAQMPALDLLAEMPRLRVLDLITTDPDGFRSAAAIARVPAGLVKLSLRGHLTWSELAPLFAREDLAIREFGFSGPAITRVLPALGGGPLASTVEQLDIAHCDPSAGLHGLLDHRGRFARLKKIRASVEELTSEARDGLSRMAKLEPAEADTINDDLGLDADELYDDIQE